jgi:hypothetical protein
MQKVSNHCGKVLSMHCLRDTILLSLLLAFWVLACLTTDGHAGCIACWELKGIIVHLEDGTTIEGYAKWNDFWAELGYADSSYASSGKEDENALRQALKDMKQFPEVIFDPKADIHEIAVYTHLRSIKYPVAKGLVTLRDPVRVNVEDIKYVNLNPGPHDGYNGAGSLPPVSERIADLLQTKPSASCHFDEVAGDQYWVSYDKSFPEQELNRLCEPRPIDRPDEEIQRLKARDIFSLYYAYD